MVWNGDADIYAATAGLAGMIAATDEFAALRASRKKITGDDRLRPMLEDYERSLRKLESDIDSDADGSVMGAVRDHYRHLCKIPEFFMYFNAEREFSGILGNAWQQLHDLIEKLICE
ncbi:MAG: YlbF family regulator [Defluviitaleaceae bacterium]|nr:YlbF family regulator [Defluviitaleaceae bacterium]MCL2836221.1 YlbF family regulator [Defluviitaleaceae bacterium]